MAKVFEVGKTYLLHSTCSYDCTARYKVIKRTAKTVTLSGDYPETDGIGKVKSFRVSNDFGAKHETCRPWGRYSMSPVLSANNPI